MSGLADALNKYRPRFKNNTPDVQHSKKNQTILQNMQDKDMFDRTVAPANKNIPGYYKGQPIMSFKNGGTVPKTGMYKLHKGEKVVSKKQLNKIAEKKLFNK